MAGFCRENKLAVAKAKQQSACVIRAVLRVAVSFHFNLSLYERAILSRSTLCSYPSHDQNGEGEGSAPLLFRIHDQQPDGLLDSERTLN